MFKNTEYWKLRMLKMDYNEDGIDHEDNNSEEAIEMTSQDNRRDKSKSAVWKHFCVDDGKNICLHCKRTVVACDGNTSNLFSHLRTRHPAKYEIAVKAKKQQQQERKSKQGNIGPPSTSAIKE